MAWVKLRAWSTSSGGGDSKVGSRPRIREQSRGALL
jgi:hypothetical protein